jgi:DNA-binding NarL/FixJ family response regulator
VAKAGASEELVRAVKAVHAGREYLCPAAATVVEPGLVDVRRLGAGGDAASLGARERQVLRLVAEGLSVAQIGERLHLPQTNVEVHRTNVLRKLQLRSGADLAGLGGHGGSHTS